VRGGRKHTEWKEVHKVEGSTQSRRKHIEWKKAHKLEGITIE
jgi:hypothetical protein